MPTIEELKAAIASKQGQTQETQNRQPTREQIQAAIAMKQGQMQGANEPQAPSNEQRLDNTLYSKRSGDRAELKPYDLGPDPFNNRDVSNFLKVRQQRIDAATAPKGSSWSEWGVNKLSNLADMFTGSKRETEKSKSLPEYISTHSRYGPYTSQQERDKNKLRDMADTAVIDSVTSPRERMEIIKKIDPRSQFKLDDKGNIIVLTSKGHEAVLNHAGWSNTDTAGLFQDVMAFLPASKIASLGPTLLKKIGLGALASGATGTARELIQESKGGSVDPLDIAIDAGAAVVGEVLPVAGTMLKNKYAKKLTGAIDETELLQAQINDKAIRTSANALEQMTNVKIPVFRAQRVGLKGILDQMATLSTMPTSQAHALSKLERQNRSVARATRKLVSGISDIKALSRGPEGVRASAKQLIDNASKLRAAKTKPFYDLAWKNDTGVNIVPAYNYLAYAMQQVDPNGKTYKMLERKMNTITSSPNLQVLDSMKKDIDEVLAKSPLEADAIGKEAKVLMTGLKNSLMPEMKKNPFYKEALDIHAKYSPDVTNLEQGIIGKIAKTKDTDLKNVSGVIFDPKQTDPAIMKNTKKLIQSVDPQAWEDIIRIELHKRISKDYDELMEKTGDVKLEGMNVPAKLLRNIYGGRGQNAKTSLLYQALSPAQRRIARYHKSILERTALGRNTGSQTASRTEWFNKLKAGPRAVMTFFTSPLKGVSELGEQAAFDKKIAAYARLLYDEEFSTEGLKIIESKKGDEWVSKAMSALLTRSLAKELKED